MTALDQRALEAATSLMRKSWQSEAWISGPPADTMAAVISTYLASLPAAPATGSVVTAEMIAAARKEFAGAVAGLGMTIDACWNAAISAALSAAPTPPVALPPAVGPVGQEDDATLTFANGEAYGLTMEQARRAIAAALQADTIPTAIDGAIKGMRVLRTMLNSRGLGGADVAEAIIGDLERMNADPAAVPAPPVQEPVAWGYICYDGLWVATRVKELADAYAAEGVEVRPLYSDSILEDVRTQARHWREYAGKVEAQKAILVDALRAIAASGESTTGDGHAAAIQLAGDTLNRVSK